MDEDLEAIGLLQDPARRALYAYVVAQGQRQVGRAEAAQAAGVQRTLAAFHLDRLARAGLLEVAYRRREGRSGRGAGRPAKLYRRAASARSISLPPRDYVLAATTFAEAIERSGAEVALYSAARERGVRAGRGLCADSSFASIADVMSHLAERGYEPHLEGTAIRLRNCPFQVVAGEFPVLACGMNLALLEGVLDGAGLSARHTAQMEPRAGECCVALVSKTNQD